MANFICAGDGINKTARSVRKTQTARFCMGMDRGDIGATRGRRKEERPTQSRKRVKGGLRPFSFAPCRVKGQRPLWGLGQRPNRSAGDQYAKRAQQRRRQRSVPASNFALPQERPPAAHSTTHILSRQMGATDQYGKRFVFPMLVFFVARGFASAEANRGLCGRPRRPFALHFHVS